MLGSIVVLGLLGVAAGLALRSLLRRKRGCGCGCDGCSGCCKGAKRE